MTAEPLPRLTTAQAAARLGVKAATVYASVSRGQLASVRDERGGSTFDALEVEALAARRSQRSRDPGPAAAAPGRPLMVLDSAITVLREDDLFFRGVRATDLAAQATFEEAAALLWTGRRPVAPVAPFAADPAAVGRARAAAGQLGEAARAADRLVLSVLVAGSSDPLRQDLAPDAVTRSAGAMIACMVEALPDAGRGSGDRPAVSGTIAEQLWPKLAAEAPQPGDLRLLGAALVLGMDHDLAVSTLAARVAASARSDPYACVAAALSAFDGPLHGSAGVAASAMITEVMASGSPERALAGQVRAGHGTPGFGHLIYRDRDPRAAFLLERMRGLPRYAGAIEAVDRLTAAVRQRLDRPANVDLAFAALAAGCGMRADAGQLLFAVSRTVGWIAHVLDEYEQTPLRLRPQSRYVAPPPAAAD